MIANTDPWRNLLSAKQVSDELRRFIAYSESLQGSNNVQLRYHGLSLAEIASLLARVKDQLLVADNRYQKEFASEFVSSAHHGVDLLLRTLSILQQQLYEASQQQGKLANILHRNSSNKKRKAGDAEADCLEILKLLLRKTNSWKRFLDHVVHVESILISISSPQLDSKCYALEIATLLLDYPDGFVLIFKALTSLAGKKRDDSRLSLLSAQLPLGLNMNKLHLQVLILRFLNKLILTAPTLNHRVIVQCEAEIAGISVERVDRIAQDHARAPEVETLRQELGVWRQGLLPLGWLESRALEHQRSTSNYPAPATMGRATYGHPRPNNSLQSNYSTTTDSEATLTRPKGERKRLFGPSPKSRSHKPSPGVDRHRNRRGSPSSLIEPMIHQNGNRSQYYGTVAARSDSEDHHRSGGTMRRIAERQRPASTVYFNEQYGTARQPLQTRSMTPEPRLPQIEAAPLDDSYRSRTLGRAGGHQPPMDGYRSAGSGPRLGRHSNSMHQLSDIGRDDSAPTGKYSERTGREHFVPIQYDSGETGTVRRRRVQSMENLMDTGVDRRDEESTRRSRGEREIPVQRGAPPMRRPAPVRQLPGEVGMGPLRRSRSDMGERPKMQGFSYLYPNKPIVEKVSPVPTTESSRDSGWGTEPQSPHAPTTAYHRPNGMGPMGPPPVQQGGHGHVTYIPIRVQGDGGSGGGAGPNPGVEIRHRSTNRPHYDDSSARSSLTTAPDSALESSLGYPQTGGSSIEHSPVRQHRYTRRNRGIGPDGRRSGVTDEVEDALRKFDYLNDYSVDDRSSSYAPFNR